MSDTSRITRSGRICTRVTFEKLQASDAKETVPYCFFMMKSEIQVGQEILEETANVLAVGEELCGHVRKLDLQEGDSVYVISAICYMRNGALCLRPSSVDQIMGTKDERITFGLSKAEFVEAKDYFQKRQRQKKPD